MKSSILFWKNGKDFKICLKEDKRYIEHIRGEMNNHLK